MNTNIRQRTTKADQLMAGWHCIFENGSERWAHPDIPYNEDCCLAVATAMQAFWNKKKELAQ